MRIVYVNMLCQMKGICALIEEFVELVNLPYDDAVVDKNIKDFLGGKKYAPDYRRSVKNILVKEAKNLSQALNPEKFRLCLAFSEDLCDDFGEVSLKKIEEYISENFNFLSSEEKANLQEALLEEVPINFAAGVVLSEKIAGKTQIISFCGFVNNPVYSLYTDMHEFAHVLQKQKFYPHLMKKLERADDEESEKFRRIVMRGYREIHANAFASAYMMAMAVKSGNDVVTDNVEKMLMQTSAYMSNALMNSGLGAAYCDWGATKCAVADIKKNGADFLFKSDGKIDFSKLYAFSFSKVKEMGYTPKMLLDADENEGKIVREIREKTKNRAEMIAEVNKIKGDNPILNDFAEAQTFYNPDEFNPLQDFYSRLVNPNMREKMLFDSRNDDLPNIKLYREIYQKNKAVKNS